MRAREAAFRAEAARAEAVRSADAARSEAEILRAELAKVRADSEAALRAAREQLEKESREGAERLSSVRVEADRLAGEVGDLKDALETARAACQGAEKRCGETEEVLTLLQARGSELCSAILGPPSSRGQLSEAMRTAASDHLELVRQYDDLRGVVRTVIGTLMGRPFTGIALAENLSGAASELRENHSRLQSAGHRLCDLALGPPAGRAQLTARLDEVGKQVHADRAELEDLRVAAARVRDVVLGSSQVSSSSLPAALESAMGVVEDRLDAAASSGVRWGTRSALVVALSHFPELEAELELLGSGRNAEVPDAELERLWGVTGPAADALAANVSGSTARSSPDDGLA